MHFVDPYLYRRHFASATTTIYQSSDYHFISSIYTGIAAVLVLISFSYFHRVSVLAVDRLYEKLPFSLTMSFGFSFRRRKQHFWQRTPPGDPHLVYTRVMASVSCASVGLLSAVRGFWLERDWTVETCEDQSILSDC